MRRANLEGVHSPQFIDRKSKSLAPNVHKEASTLVERWKDVVRAARERAADSQSTPRPTESQAAAESRQHGGRGTTAPPSLKRRKAGTADMDESVSLRNRFCTSAQCSAHTLPFYCTFGAFRLPRGAAGSGCLREDTRECARASSRLPWHGAWCVVACLGCPCSVG